MSRRDRERWDELGNDGPGWKHVFWFFAVIAVLGAGFTVIGFANGWFHRATQVVGPANVSEQFKDVAQEYQSLQTSAANACQAVTDAERGDSAPTLVESPALAYEATYRRIAASYNRRMTNIFEAGIVAPPGYPESVPIPVGEVDWCGLVGQLEAARS